jgi:RNA polymerase primary sigma factor
MPSKKNAYSEQYLERYLKEISEVRLLTSAEEIDLAKKVQSGDMSALDQITKANLRFVVSVAKQYQNQGLSLGDLINEGNLGLIKAAYRFDVTRGFKFISYAVWWIRQSILQALAEQSRVVRLPLNRVGAIHKIGKAFCNLEQEFEREPSETEIAAALQMSAMEVVNTLRMSGKQISLDAPLNEDAESRLLDVLENEELPPPDRILLEESLRIEIEMILKGLTSREAEVIRLYFGLGQEHPLTLEEIGERFNLTRERVRQIKEKAIKRLRHSSRSKPLRSFLG